MFSRLILFGNSLRNRLVKRRVRPENVLLLIPHCLQRSECPKDILREVDQCARCGRCRLGDLLDLRDEFGVQCHVVGGGHQAVERANDPSVKIIVAVACEKELAAGIVSVPLKPVIAVPNTRPHGPCHDTQVDIGQVRRALLEAIGAEEPIAER